MRRHFWTYVLASRSRCLYIGVTGDLDRRLQAHKAGRSTFTRKYRIHRLVYFEVFESVWDAIAREKQLKGWRRERKVRLVERYNPEWKDLSSQLEEIRTGLLG